MSVGEFEIGLSVFAILNAVMAYWTWHERREFVKHREQFHKSVELIQAELREQATQIQAAQFHVCQRCGKIVQGICLNCLVPTNESV